MKRNIIIREINCSIQKVFDFTVNPNNTPLWINTVIEEKTDSKTINLGTRYYQLVKLPKGKIEKSCAVITGFVENEFIEFSYIGTTYKCSYSYVSTEKGTILTYYEEAMKDEDLENFMTESSMDYLKALLDHSS